MKAIICFKKQDSSKYISHLDLQRTVDRALRRSGVAVQFSTGYNPHIQMSFAFALKVGLTSDSEYLEVQIDENTDIKKAEQAIKNCFPNGLEVNWVKIKKENTKKLMASISKAEYEIILNDIDDYDKIEGAIKEILSLDEMELVKKTKKGTRSFDARPLIFELGLEKEGNKIAALLSAQEKGTLDPNLLMQKILLVAGIKCEYTIIRKNLLTTIDGISYPLSHLAL